MLEKESGPNEHFMSHDGLTWLQLGWDSESVGGGGISK